MKNWSMRKQKEGHSCSISDDTSELFVTFPVDVSEMMVHQNFL